MPQHTRRVDHLEVYRLSDAGYSQGAISRQLGCSQGYVSKLLKARLHLGLTNGEPPGEPDALLPPPTLVHPSKPNGEPIALQHVELSGEPSGGPGLPDIAGQHDLDELKARVEVLETSIATLQQQLTSLPDLPNGSPVVYSGSPTHKRGFVMHDDVFEAIHAYADAHHLQVKDVVDLALRSFFVVDGARV